MKKMLDDNETNRVQAIADAKKAKEEDIAT